MSRHDRAAIVAEAIGTFLFFFVGAGAVVVASHAAAGGGGLVGVALAHGLVLAVLVSAFGSISGGHFNPAVTFAIWVNGGIATARAAMYWAAQLVGALAAGFALRGLFAESMWGPTNIGSPALAGGFSPVAGIIIEAVLTMVLVFTVFGTAVDRRAPRIGGTAIGLAVAADILLGGPITGAAMNPARWFGPAVAAGALQNWYVWWIGPLLGAGIAALIYRYFLAETEELEVTPATPEG